MAIKMEWGDQGLYRRFYGRVTGKEVFDSTAVMFGSSKFDDLEYIISDYLEVSESLISEKEAKQIAYICYAAAKSNPRIKVAMVVAEKNLKVLGEHISNEFEKLDMPWQTAIFSTESQAQAWIDNLR